MGIELSGPVSDLVLYALNASTMRHNAIANNIANINTPGYRPLTVSFEDKFNQHLAISKLSDDVGLKRALSFSQPEFVEMKIPTGTNQLDIEMVDMAKNTLRYETLIKGLKGYGAITKLAIKEGKI